MLNNKKKKYVQNKIKNMFLIKAFEELSISATICQAKEKKVNIPMLSHSISLIFNKKNFNTIFQRNRFLTINKSL